VAERPIHRRSRRLLRVLVLGGGTPSTSLLLLSLAGQLPRLDAVVFPDTGFERRAVSEHVARLERVARPAGVALYRVGAGSLRDAALDPAGHDRAGLPLLLADADGRGRRLPARCATRYRAAPVGRKVRELWRTAGRPPVELWLGLAREDAARAPRSPCADAGPVRYRFPLIERGLTRSDCQRWLAAHGWAAPTAGCVGCPLQSDLRWAELRDTTPDQWAEAVAFDRSIRGGHPRQGSPPPSGEAFVHRSLVPLDQVNLDGPADRAVIDGFGNECEGMCAT
jgi:hypothetical protein